MKYVLSVTHESRPSVRQYVSGVIPNLVIGPFRKDATEYASWAMVQEIAAWVKGRSPGYTLGYESATQGPDFIIQTMTPETSKEWFLVVMGHEHGWGLVPTPEEATKFGTVLTALEHARRFLDFTENPQRTTLVFAWGPTPEPEIFRPTVWAVLMDGLDLG